MQREISKPGTGDELDVFSRATARAGDPSHMPRTVVVVAHPDDESLAIGGRMSRFCNAQFIHITDGAPINGQDAAANGFASVDEYRAARQIELRNALRAGGIEQPHLHTLNIPDQQAVFRLTQVTQSLAELFAEIRPEAIFTHPYEGGHPDHDACAFAVHHAIAMNMNQTGRAAPPVVVETPFYHATSTGMVTGTFAPASRIDLERSDALTELERTRKRHILACFTSQRETLQQFSLDDERFRVAPLYDFTQPPHAGPILYDRFPWGVDGRRFLELAAAAEAQLSPEPIPCR